MRLSGQDAERGTFSHRHAVLHDTNTGGRYIPLQHLEGGAPFEIYNSPLSETAVLGFEYGFSAAVPEALVLWEAQYGDFVNVAQPIIDQFICRRTARSGDRTPMSCCCCRTDTRAAVLSTRARGWSDSCNCAPKRTWWWPIRQPPRSTSTSCAVTSTTPSRRPLVLMTPKSLLRLDRAASRLADLTTGHFQAVLADPAAADAEARAQVTRVVFCSGKIYYDLSAADGRCTWRSCGPSSSIRGRTRASRGRSTCIRPLTKWCGRRKNRRTWERGRSLRRACGRRRGTRFP